MFENTASQERQFQDKREEVAQALDKMQEEHCMAYLRHYPEKLEAYLACRPDFFLKLSDSDIKSICNAELKCCEQVISFFQADNGKKALLRQLNELRDRIKSAPLCRSR